MRHLAAQLGQGNQVVGAAVAGVGAGVVGMGAGVAGWGQGNQVAAVGAGVVGVGAGQSGCRSGGRSGEGEGRAIRWWGLGAGVAGGDGGYGFLLPFIQNKFLSRKGM